MTVGRATLLAALAIGLGVTGCGGKASPKPSTAHRSSATPRSPDQSAEVEFGYIESLTPLAKGYKLRFDLHLYLSGMTGLRACVDNHDCPPGTTSLLDDVYDHDLKFVLTYYVPPDARVRPHPRALGARPGAATVSVTRSPQSGPVAL